VCLEGEPNDDISVPSAKVYDLSRRYVCYAEAFIAGRTMSRLTVTENAMVNMPDDESDQWKLVRPIVSNANPIRLRATMEAETPIVPSTARQTLTQRMEYHLRCRWRGTERTCRCMAFRRCEEDRRRLEVAVPVSGSELSLRHL
jgi:head-tail adaptor